MLGSAEMLNLRGVLADDPLRAVQVLPGVATGDDLRSEFTVRGSDFTPPQLHASTASRRRTCCTPSAASRIAVPTGSVAMINSDVLEDVTLLNGGYPQRYGGHTGAEVDFRAARRIARTARSSASRSAAPTPSAVAEGPIGRGAARIVAGVGAPVLSRSHRPSHLTEALAQLRLLRRAGARRLRSVAVAAARSDGAGGVNLLHGIEANIRSHAAHEQVRA